MVRTVLLVIVFLLSLNFGVLEAIGINVSRVRIAIEAVMLLLLVSSVLRASRGDLLRTLKWIGLPLVAASIGVVVAVFYRASYLEILLFARETVIPLVFFALFLLDPPDERGWKMLSRVILLIAAVQLPVAVWKYSMLGVNEKGWIGTFHQDAGQLGLLMPMLAMVFLWTFAIKRGRLFVPVLLATGFALISVVNEKRAVVLIVPFLVSFLIAVNLLAARLNGRPYRAWYCKSEGLRHLLVAILLSVIVVIACALHNIPSFDNSTREYDALPGRSVPAFVAEYLLRDYDSAMNKSTADPDVGTNRNIQMGRLRLWANGMDIALRLPAGRMLFGAGGGWLLEHPLLSGKPKDLFFERLHLRGPTSTGFRHLFEIGIAGLLLMLLWMGQIGWALLRRTGDASTGMIALGATGALAILVFDYLLYSQVGWSGGVFAPLCFLVIARALQDHDARH